MLRISVSTFVMELRLESQFSVSLYTYRLMVYQLLFIRNVHADQEKIINVVIFEFFD